MKNQLGQDVVHLDCQCTHPLHYMRVVYEPGRAASDEDPELYIDVQFPPCPWYKRLWVALRYVFGKRESWTEHCLTDTGVVNLGRIVQKYKLVKTLRQAIRAKKARKEVESGEQTSNGLDRVP